MQVQRATPRTLCELYFAMSPGKTLGLRIDVLAQLLLRANVHAGVNVLCVDSAYGLPTAAVLERLGGMGCCVQLHAGSQPVTMAVTQCNFSPAIMAALYTYELGALGELQPLPADLVQSAAPCDDSGRPSVPADADGGDAAVAPDAGMAPVVHDAAATSSAPQSSADPEPISAISETRRQRLLAKRLLDQRAFDGCAASPANVASATRRLTPPCARCM